MSRLVLFLLWGDRRLTVNIYFLFYFPPPRRVVFIVVVPCCKQARAAKSSTTAAQSVRNLIGRRADIKRRARRDRNQI